MLHLSFTGFLKVKNYFLFSLVLFCIMTAPGFAAAPPDSTSEGNKSLPTLSVAYGIMTFLGDVGYSHLNQPLFNPGGFQVELQKHTNTRFSFSLFLLSGKLYGNEQSLTRNLNFQSGIVSEGIQVRYDFISKTNTRQGLIPFISAGIEYVSFHPKADLKDASGNYYHYWKDGTIRSLAQDDPNAGQAVLIHRDYTYETELRDANIDGFGKFKTTAFGFPIGAGVRLKLSGRCSMHFSSVCHFTNTDLIDAVNIESIGSRQGNDKNDRFIFSSVSFRYDFSGARETPKRLTPKPNIDISNVDYAVISKEDADHDGVPDIDDEEPQTPENVPVDSKGRSLDTDGDGIPDYRDMQPNSSKDSMVNEKGVTVTEAMIEEQLLRDSLGALPSIIEYLKSGLNNPDTAKIHVGTGRKPASKTAGIPNLYRKVDVDANGVISPQEISDAIDAYLAGKSSYSSDQFYRLIDFFFKQQ